MELGPGLRARLQQLTTEWVLDEELLSVLEFQNRIQETNKYRNWYLGFTEASLNARQSVEVHTSAARGAFVTPYFQQKPFSENSFDLQTQYLLTISPSTNFTRYKNASLCVEVNKDTKETFGGTEYIKVWQGFKSQQIVDGKQNVTYCYKSSVFRQNTEKTKFIMVDFIRVLTLEQFDLWAKKRFTGLALTWYYKDTEDNIITIPPEAKYKNEDGNRIFIVLVNIVDILGEWGIKNMWSRIKEFKVNLLNSKKDQMTRSCASPSSYSSLNADAFVKYELIDEFLQNFTEEVNMTDAVRDPVDADFSDLSLKVAAAMFFYLRKCPHGGDGFGYQLVEKINKFFEIGSSRTIWETMSNVYKNNLNANPGDIDFSQIGLENIIDILSNEIKSSLAELEVFTLTNSTFAVYKNDNVIFGNITRQTSCLKSKNGCSKSQLERIKEQQRFVNHPVHIIDDTEKISPSSFIPFCSLGGKMSMVGHSIPGFSVPICNSFKPYNLLGQVDIYTDNVINKASPSLTLFIILQYLHSQICYKMDVNSFTQNIDQKDITKIGLKFVLDYNEDRWGSLFPRKMENSFTEVDVLSKDNKNVLEGGFDAQIYFQNIGRYLEYIPLINGHISFFYLNIYLITF